MTDLPHPLATFDGAVCQVKTMADGSPRYTFEAGEGISDITGTLARCQEEKRYLTIVIYDAEEIRKITKGN